MADIKIDKYKYFNFLRSVKSLLESLDTDALPAAMQAELYNVLSYTDKEFEISDLMEQRKLFYDYYVKNVKRDPISANAMYERYKETQAKIEELRKDV